MGSFRTLDFAVEFYHLTEELKVARHLRDQLLRASSSISLNLAEGNAKFSSADRSRFFQIAYGSFRECQAIFRLIRLPDPTLLKLSDRLGGSLYNLVQKTRELAAKKPNL